MRCVGRFVSAISLSFWKHSNFSASYFTTPELQTTTECIHYLFTMNHGYIGALQFNIDAVEVVKYIGQISQTKQELHSPKIAKIIALQLPQNILNFAANFKHSS